MYLFLKTTVVISWKLSVCRGEVKNIALANLYVCSANTIECTYCAWQNPSPLSVVLLSHLECWFSSSEQFPKEIYSRKIQILLYDYFGCNVYVFLVQKSDHVCVCLRCLMEINCDQLLWLCNFKLHFWICNRYLATSFNRIVASKSRNLIEEVQMQILFRILKLHNQNNPDYLSWL